MYGIARKKALMHLRSHRHESGIPIENVEDSFDSAPLPETQVIINEQKTAVLQALRALPKDYGDVLYLAYFEDMTYDQVAKVLKKNKKQVYNLANRGKERLREILEKQEGIKGTLKSLFDIK
jgi:RNA polymerase sigma-70 factor (ECF subfamily)